jgi:hypothetical protein
MNNKIKDFWEKYEYKIILIIGFILVAIVSFEVGILRGQKIEKNPLIIEKPTEIQIAQNPTNQVPLEAQKTPQEVKNSPESANTSSQIVPTGSQNCVFVGSKNSNKYHLPTCRWAKNIKPENQICFSGENEAKLKGYVADKNCIK